MANVMHWLKQQHVVTVSLAVTLLSLASWFGYHTGVDQLEHRVLRTHLDAVTALLTTVTIFAIDGKPAVAKVRAITQPSISRLLAENVALESRPMRQELEKTVALRYAHLALTLVNNIIESEDAEEMAATAAAQAAQDRDARSRMSADKRLQKPELGSGALVFAMGAAKATRAKAIDSVVDIWPMINRLKRLGYPSSAIIEESTLGKYAWQLNVNPRLIELTEAQMDAMSTQWDSRHRPR